MNCGWFAQTVTQICGGHGHTTVLTSTGDVWGFGSGVFGQLGTSLVNKKTVPIPVYLPENIRLIATSYFHNVSNDVTQVVWWVTLIMIYCVIACCGRVQLSIHLGLQLPSASSSGSGSETSKTVTGTAACTPADISANEQLWQPQGDVVS